METIYLDRVNEIKQEKGFLEKKLNVRISLEGKKVTVEGETFDEYDALRILDAISLGFSVKTAMLLKDEDFSFEKISIKNYTRRKNLDVIRSRLIGTHGKTKNTIEEIAGCKIKVTEREVGIIGPAESIRYASTAIMNIIKGSKQANVYRYLERINTMEKNRKIGRGDYLNKNKNN